MTNNKDKETGFISHLVELRKRLINSFIFLSVLFVISYYFSEYNKKLLNHLVCSEYEISD